MIIDGKAIAAEVLARAKARAEALGRAPKVVAYVAQDPTPATISYLKIKKKSAELAGCVFEERHTPTFFKDADAAIVQLPTVPGAENFMKLLPAEKDADVLGDAARAAFMRGDEKALLPPVVGAVKEILERAGVEAEGKNAVIVGSGFLVGAPVAAWLAQQGAHVMSVNQKSGDLMDALKHADIVVSGAGSPHLIKPEMLKAGVVIIDAGTSESGGTLAGDADPACAKIASVFTPVPGGVGPIAVAKLFENAIVLAERATG